MDTEAFTAQQVSLFTAELYTVDNNIQASS